MLAERFLQSRHAAKLSQFCWKCSGELIFSKSPTETNIGSLFQSCFYYKADQETQNSTKDSLQSVQLWELCYRARNRSSNVVRSQIPISHLANQIISSYSEKLWTTYITSNAVSLSKMLVSVGIWPVISLLKQNNVVRSASSPSATTIASWSSSKPSKKWVIRE